VESYTNGTLTVGGTTVFSQYGGNFVHKFTTDIEPLLIGLPDASKAKTNNK